MPLDIKIDLSQFTKIEDRIRSQAEVVLANPDLKKEVGDFAVERLRYQARTGSPYNAARDLPLLRDSTILHRTYLAKYNPTHPTFEEGFSNLTITGELLDSLTWIDQGNTLLKLAFTGMHKPYKGVNGKRISKTIMNETIARYLAEKGFKVFDISLESNKQFVSRIKTICLRYIRRGLRIRNRLDSDSVD